jgi:hypothetical protein
MPKIDPLPVEKRTSSNINVTNTPKNPSRSSTKGVPQYHLVDGS